MALSVRYASDTQYIESRMDCREWLLDVLFFGWKSGGEDVLPKDLQFMSTRTVDSSGGARG